MHSVPHAQRRAARIAMANPPRSHRPEMVGGAGCADEVARRDADCGMAKRVFRDALGLLIVGSR